MKSSITVFFRGTCEGGWSLIGLKLDHYKSTMNFKQQAMQGIGYTRERYNTTGRSGWQ
ncbi:hypothetical protein [Planococcus soli]|uniref:hypothetical protein n=1 Tax=Planococcus soli TaxID=2666072 RepID=UPI00163D9797|nr:hypothetical protein [Planococcus soli]